MKGIIKKCFVIMLCFILAISNMTYAYSENENVSVNNSSDLFGGYYPISTDDEEWSTLDYNQQIEACRIDADVLEKMSTEELIDCVLCHPLVFDIFCFDNTEDALNYLRSISDAYAELEKRKDYTTKIEAYINDHQEDSFVKVAVLKMMSGQTVEGSMSLENGLPVESVMSGFNGNQGSLHSETVNGRTIYYISGSYTLYNKTESAYQYYSNDFTSTQKTAMDQSMLSSHPTWTKLGTATGRYNCHSYAWVSTNMSTNIWRITGCTNFASSTNFTFVGTNVAAQAGDIIRIGNAHSMIVTSGGVSSSTIRVKSKLGFNGVFVTTLSDMKTMYASAGANYYVYRP